MQTIDMVEELKRRGWQDEQILLIDNDEGVSGTKRIDERAGMSYLFELIAEGKIGAVACQDEDRLFRDMTQIQVNIFIDTCRRANVKVITPYITYDFAHPLHGEFHARQFRFKCDMAAEYLKSYVLGRLAPARQKLLREGKWAGARVPVGYMVDNRKVLPDGTENPNWRRFVPFEPYAEVVRQYFRVFLECGGAIRETVRQIPAQGISFPTCSPPEGFKISYQLKNRDGMYYLNRNSLISLLTNPVYIGHWCYQGVVVCWNNHEPIVGADAFLRAFNYLSKYTLTGEENEDYQPAYPFVRPNRDAERSVERPLLAGLIYSEIDGSWYRAGCSFENRNSCYLYVQYRVEPVGTVLEWARRANWFDEAVVTRFKQKLHSTFDSEAWLEALEDSQKLIERERKLKQMQLVSVVEGKQNLLTSLMRLTHPDFIQEAEQRYLKLEEEEKRLKEELANIELKQQSRVSLDQAINLFSSAASDWERLSADERRSTLALFIERIEASDYSRAGDMRLLIIWRDGSQDEIQLWHKSHASHWSFENVEWLLSLYDSGANQLEIAAAFPDLKWYQIFNEIKKHRGIVRFTPSWLGKNETYREYEASGGRKGRASGSYWRDEELAALREMVERNATQLEIMQEFPFRRWVYIKERIKRLFGKGTRVPLSGIPQKMTYTEYAQQVNTANDDISSETEARCCGSRRARAHGFPEPPRRAVRQR